MSSSSTSPSLAEAAWAVARLLAWVAGRVLALAGLLVRIVCWLGLTSLKLILQGHLVAGAALLLLCLVLILEAPALLISVAVSIGQLLWDVARSLASMLGAPVAIVLNAGATSLLQVRLQHPAPIWLVLSVGLMLLTPLVVLHVDPMAGLPVMLLVSTAAGLGSALVQRLVDRSRPVRPYEIHWRDFR